MRKITNKLVRDNIPDIIQANGGFCKISVMDDITYRKELIKKMHEEIEEFNKDDNVEELADIYEVFCALVRFKGYHLECIQQEAKRKSQNNGGFYKKYFMKEYDDGKE